MKFETHSAPTSSKPINTIREIFEGLLLWTLPNNFAARPSLNTVVNIRKSGPVCVRLQVTAGLFAGAAVVASFYGYIYTYDHGDCHERPVTTVINVFIWTTELTFNVVGPLSTVLLNVLVIRSLLAARRARSHELMCVTVPQNTDVCTRVQIISRVAHY